jgi:hypothetical protein
MRWDMYEVIIERPRSGSRTRGFKGRDGERMRDLADPENARTFESTSRKRGGSKYLNENLAPLYRFLRSRLGRPWDEVHSEISATLRLTSAVQKHVLDHLHDMVHTNVVKDGERLIEHGDWGVREVDRYYRRGLFYVCPDTGTLKEHPSKKWQRPKEPLTVIKVSPVVQYRKIGEIWYSVTLAPVPKNTSDFYAAYDVVFGKQLGDKDFTWWDRYREYGDGNRYACGKRQLNKRQLKRVARELKDE